MCEGEKGKTEKAAEIVKAIGDQFPLYGDLLKPPAGELGAEGAEIVRTVRSVMEPVHLLVRAYAERAKEWVSAHVAAKLRDVPQDRIITPNPAVAGPVLQSLAFTFHEEPLREMFVKLLATAMDQETAQKAHPCFAEIIRQMVPDEARIVRFVWEGNPTTTIVVLRSPMRVIEDGVLQASKVELVLSFVAEEAGCDHTDLMPSYLDNLKRLHLLDTGLKEAAVCRDLRERLANHPSVREAVAKTRADRYKADLTFHDLTFTSMGKQFCSACLGTPDCNR